MKKFIFLACILCLVASQVFGNEIKDFRISINNQDVKFDLSNFKKKDPKLIKITNISSVDKNKYAKKLEEDNKEYAKYKKTMNDTYYELYRIIERLLRANNLYYQNWRILIKKDAEDINAMTGYANLIIVNTSMYDSFYNDKDALASVLAHEFAHQIYEHGQKSTEIAFKIKQMEENIYLMKEEAKRQRALSNLGSLMGDYTYAPGSALSSTSYAVSTLALKSMIKKYHEEERKQEIEADSEGIVLMARAGYDVNCAKNVMKLFSKIPGIYTTASTHPTEAARISNANRVINSLDLDELKKEGENNIYNSPVLEVKKSSDEKSIVISKAEGAEYDSYAVKNKENRLLKKAYRCYLDDDFRNAKIYFEEAFEENSKNYIPALYLSYIDELEYYKTKNVGSLKNALSWAKKANKINSNANTVKQRKDVENILKNSKKNK